MKRGENAASTSNRVKDWKEWISMTSPFCEQNFGKLKPGLKNYRYFAEHPPSVVLELLKFVLMR